MFLPLLQDSHQLGYFSIHELALGCINPQQLETMNPEVGRVFQRPKNRIKPTLPFRDFKV